MKKIGKKIGIAVLAVVLVLAVVFFGYTQAYYKAAQTVEMYQKQNAAIAVKKEKDWYLLDGPSEEKALIFYPGAKVEETAYLPMLMEVAETMDVVVVSMPFHLAFFGMNAAKNVQEAYDYADWYIGGHSLGGAMSAAYASKNPNAFAGVILFAAYPTKDLANLPLLSIVGEQDQVIRKEKIEEGKQYAIDAQYVEIAGGNHGQFGDYGFQKGDGEASISAQEQWKQTADCIAQWIAG